MIEALRRLLNRRFWRKLVFASWHQRCDCPQCSLHIGRCPFPQSGERYKGAGLYAVLSYCAACALNHAPLELDRCWGRGHGAKTRWEWQQADYGEEGVFR